ncbi:family 43 glycosylhydrolase [Rufibacter sediminis]
MRFSKNIAKTALLLFLLGASFSSALAQKGLISNPIMKGYFADPSLVKEKDTYYIYATIDPWGGEELAVFETKDFKTFTQRHLNWPTKKACTSPTSSGAMVWAPAVRKAPNGKYYMYVSVGSEIWAGVSNSPLGPWKNAKADNTPLVAAKDFPQVHNIDADLFIDEDGSAYLYWGSGFNWVNGHCMAVKLKKDMVTFDGTPKDVTPPHYFEGPHMIKRNGKYYLMFSEGKAIDATYRVGYAVGNTPFGPFTPGENSPILTTSSDSTTYGPGHHTVFREKGQDYILYHRIFPQKAEYVLRQLCLDSLNYSPTGALLKINPTGVAPFTQSKAQKSR